jgi:hypothetical protein
MDMRIIIIQKIFKKFNLFISFKLIFSEKKYSMEFRPWNHLLVPFSFITDQIGSSLLLP